MYKYVCLRIFNEMNRFVDHLWKAPVSTRHTITDYSDAFGQIEFLNRFCSSSDEYFRPTQERQPTLNGDGAINHKLEQKRIRFRINGELLQCSAYHPNLPQWKPHWKVMLWKSIPAAVESLVLYTIQTNIQAESNWGLCGMRMRNGVWSKWKTV